MRLNVNKAGGAASVLPAQSILKSHSIHLLKEPLGVSTADAHRYSCSFALARVVNINALLNTA